MKETASTLKSFFREFGIPAYARNKIPDEVTIPYIAYDLIEPRWNEQGNASCQVYYPKNQSEELLTKADEILAAIGEGVKITMPGGYLILYLAETQGQEMADTETDSIYISLIINSYHTPGS